MAPAKLKGTLSSLVQSWNTVAMHPSLFKALCSISYWSWVGHPMDKHTLIIKGGTIRSTILAAAVKVSCSYCTVYLYLYCVPYYAVSLCSNAGLLSRLYS